MRIFFCGLFVVCVTHLFAVEESSKKLTPKEALQKLLAGNTRAIEERVEHPDHFKESRMEAMVAKQEPYAVIVACSDSRVSPEILFDQGIGDIFVVRVAGNVVGDLELESIHYAVTQLKAAVILVMGHENCGAVQAVLSGKDQTMPEIGALIKPAIKKCNSLQEAVEANVRLVVKELSELAFIKEAVKKGDLEVRGSYYHLQNGVVRLLFE